MVGDACFADKQGAKCNQCIMREAFEVTVDLVVAENNVEDKDVLSAESFSGVCVNFFELRRNIHNKNSLRKKEFYRALIIEMRYISIRQTYRIKTSENGVKTGIRQ